MCHIENLHSQYSPQGKCLENCQIKLEKKYNLLYVITIRKISDNPTRLFDYMFIILQQVRKPTKEKKVVFITFDILE